MIPSHCESIYKALANKRRLFILMFLSDSGVATVHEVADRIGLSLKATSKHLLILKSRGIVSSVQIGLEQNYSIKRPVHKIVKQFLSISDSRE